MGSNKRIISIYLFAIMTSVVAVIEVSDRWLANDALIFIQTLRDTCEGGILKSVQVYDTIPNEQKSSCNPGQNIYLRSLLPQRIKDCYNMPERCKNGVIWRRGDLKYSCDTDEQEAELKIKAQILIIAACERPEYVNQKEEEINLKSNNEINIPLCSDGKKAQATYALHTTSCAKPPEIASKARTDLPQLLTDINECQTKSCTGRDLMNIHPDDEYKCIDEEGRNLTTDDIQENLYVTWSCPGTIVVLELLNNSSSKNLNNTAVQPGPEPGTWEKMTASNDRFLIPLIVVCVAIAILVIAFIVTIICFLKYQGKQQDVIYSLEEAKPVPPPPSKSDLYTKVNKGVKRRDGVINAEAEPQSDEYLIPANEQKRNKASVAVEYSKVDGRISMLDDDDTYELPQSSNAISNPNLHGRTLPETPQYESVVDKLI